MDPPGASTPAGAPAPRPRRLSPARLRRFGLLVPLHLTAFAALYLGTDRLLEKSFAEGGATTARLALDQAVRQLPLLFEAGRPGRSPHQFEHLVAAHEPIGLALHRADGSLAGLSLLSGRSGDRARVRAFLAEGTARQQSWLESAGERTFLRGAKRIVAEGACTTCHRAGATLGVATVRVDFTAERQAIREELRGRLVLLFGAWVGLLAGVTWLVQKTVRSSAARLEAELAGGAPGGGTVPLDPATAELHRALGEVVRRQRERETQVVTRLARVDQLASLGQLAAGLAHEIKNPLAGIQGALELLRDESADEETKTLYVEMLGELARVHGILKRLLESGRPAPLRLARCDLGRLVEETAELLRPALRRSRVELVTELAPGLPPLELDPAKIRQVLINLIQNAAEAIGERGGRVAVRAGTVGHEAAAVVAVEDDGPGIPPEQLPRLFEPFFTTKYAGTGLGLAISKSLVEQHGGRIEASSEPGRGTTFLVVLPAAPPGEAGS
jgi:signal transduction histidine kinase